MVRNQSTSSHISIRGLGLFLGRIALELDTMRGRMFDHERKQLGNDNHDAARLLRLEAARTKMFEAHAALIAAQAELLKSGESK